MHVVWVNRTANFVGGAERYIADVVRSLGTRGIRSTLLYSTDGWTEPTFTQLFDGAFPCVDPSLQLRQIRPDVLYVHQLENERSAEALARSGVPAVRFLHDHKLFCLREHKYKTLSLDTCTQRVGARCYSCLGFLTRKEGRFQLATVRAQEQALRANRALDAAVVGSEYMREHALLHGFSPEQVHHLPFPVQDTPLSETPPREDNRLLFVGALVRGKGLDLLLRAMTELPRDTRLLVVGQGPQEGVYREQVRDLALADRVHFAGRLDRHTVATWYARAACVVIPSRSPETFSLVGAEALLQAAPVVASKVGGIPQWLRHRETGLFFEPGNAASLAAALGEVLENPAQARQWGMAGQQWVQSHHSMKTHVEQLTALLEELA